MDFNLMVVTICCMGGAFVGTYAAVLHLFSKWDEEIEYEDYD